MGTVGSYFQRSSGGYVLPFQLAFACGLLAVSVLTSCSSFMAKRAEGLSTVKLGLEKPDVIELAGSPNRSERQRGVDRWFYVIYEGEAKRTVEVQFTGGQVTYIGPEKTGDSQGDDPAGSTTTEGSQSESSPSNIHAPQGTPSSSRNLDPRSIGAGSEEYNKYVEEIEKKRKRTRP